MLNLLLMQMDRDENITRFVLNTPIALSSVQIINGELAPELNHAEHTLVTKKVYIKT